jgi:hypothetical protein
VNKKRIIVRICAILLLALLGFIMFRVGRKHTILLDNKTIEIQGEEFKALDIVEIQVNKLEELELAKRDRDLAEVMGQSQKVRVTYTDSEWNEIEIERKIKVPHKDVMIVFSIPAFIEHPDDSTYYLVPFESPN